MFVMDCLRQLQDPELVVDFQRYFGVTRRPKLVPDSEHDALPLSERSASSAGCWQSKQLVGQKEVHGKAYISSKRGECESVDHDYKTSHKRRGSCSDAESCDSGLSWKDALFGGTVGGSEWNSSGTEDKKTDVVISNRFWYYLFLVATKTGDEIFYMIFFPFWAWNVDGAILRRIMDMWMVTMYIGQALKDILKVPRPPCPPVVRLDSKWCQEYGLPSTHAMVGFSIPFSILYFSVGRYQIDWTWGFMICIVWCSLVCASRIYLGMHSVLDIVLGLVLISLLMAVMLPWMDTVDHLALSHPATPLISIILTIAMIVYYPATDQWTSARGDTTVIVGVGCGALIASWLHYQTGMIREPSLQPPYTVMWPTLTMAGLSILRSCIGLAMMIAVRAIFKSLSLATICALLQVSENDYKSNPGSLPRNHRLIVELTYKFITYLAIGFIAFYLAPLAFRLIGIERPTFYTEV